MGPSFAKCARDFAFGLGSPKSGSRSILSLSVNGIQDLICHVFLRDLEVQEFGIFENQDPE